jgi:hypothetical protein
MKHIEQLLQDLALARQLHATAKEAARVRMEEFIASDDVYSFQKAASDNTAVAIAELEEKIRNIVLAEYQTSGSKSPHPKVAVKIFKSFNVTDAAKVLAWVKTNLADALTYDPKKVKDYATKIGPVEGTEIVEQPRAQIASDLQ